MFTHILTRSDVASVKRLAEQSARHFSGKAGHYGNEPRKHFVGHVGEMAFSRWLQARGVEHHPRFLDPHQLEWADIETWDPRLCIEVKTWSAATWADLGRCIAKRQAASVKHKAHIVAWMVAETTASEWTRPAREIAVRLAGWNTVAEILAQPVTLTGELQIANHQLRLDQVRMAETLAAMLAGVTA